MALPRPCWCILGILSSRTRNMHQSEPTSQSRDQALRQVADLNEREVLALTRQAGTRLYWDTLWWTLLFFAALLVLGLVTGFRPLVWILSEITRELLEYNMDHIAHFFGG